MGGSISDETVDESSPTAAKPKAQSNLYVQGLRTDIQRLRQKYYAQQASSQVVPVVSQSATEQPINPEFRANQATETLQPTVRKQRPTKDSSRVPATTRGRVATVPITVDASESLKALRGRQVSPALPPLGGVDTYLPNPSSTPFKGYIWPAKGVLTSGYGWRWGRMHKGIDVAAPIGTPIVAAAPGVVVRAGWNSGGYGKLVDIRHADGAVTRYAHNSRILVQSGQLVEQGQQISEMGSTGFSTGPHLHFEVHPAGKAAVNPIALLPRNRR
jgi:murein DD-endopeptidase MepM/ murein hydrolase activator NlpD